MENASSSTYTNSKSVNDVFDIYKRNFDLHYKRKHLIYLKSLFSSSSETIITKIWSSDDQLVIEALRRFKIEDISFFKGKSDLALSFLDDRSNYLKSAAAIIALSIAFYLGLSKDLEKILVSTIGLLISLFVGYLLLKSDEEKFFIKSFSLLIDCSIKLPRITPKNGASKTEDCC